MPLLRAKNSLPEPLPDGAASALPNAGGDTGQATVVSGYENVGGPLTHVNSKGLQNGRNGFALPQRGRSPPPGSFASEPGKVRPVPDHAVLNLPESMAPRSYEALQLYDSAPRGFSLAQPS